MDFPVTPRACSLLGHAFRRSLRRLRKAPEHPRQELRGEDPRAGRQNRLQSLRRRRQSRWDSTSRGCRPQHAVSRPPRCSFGRCREACTGGGLVPGGHGRREVLARAASTTGAGTGKGSGSACREGHRVASWSCPEARSADRGAGGTDCFRRASGGAVAGRRATASAQVLPEPSAASSWSSPRFRASRPGT